MLAYGCAAAAEAGTWLAIGVYAYDRTGPGGVGVVGLLLLLPAAIAAPFASSFADRHRRQRVLVAAYLVQAVALLAVAVAMVLDVPPWITILFASLASVAITPLRPTQGALLPSISREPADLTAGNIALTTIRNVGLLLGSIVAGPLLRGSGDPGVVFAVFAAALFFATVLVARITSDPPRGPRTNWTGAHVMEGVRLMRRESRATLVVAMTFVKHVVMGAVRAFLVVVALSLLGLGSGGPAALSVALAVGGAVGGLASVALVGRRHVMPAMVLGSLLLGLPLVVLGVRPTIAIALLALGLVGVGRSVVDVAGRTLLGRIAPEDAMARVLGMVESSTYAGLAIGSGVAAVTIDRLGVGSALIVTGLLMPLAALVLLLPLRAVDRSPLVSLDRLTLLLRVPMFTPLPAMSIERLAAQLHPVVAPPDVELITQGARGDAFYVVESGCARATVDGDVVATYGPGDSFGEIALLKDVPRTATVTTLEPSVVLSLDRVAFLSILTDEPASLVAADEVAERRMRDTAERA